VPKQNLTQFALKSLIKKTGRHADGGGLYFRVIGKGKTYWVFRYRLNGVERETSLGRYPELSLEEARVRHAELRKQVKVDKIDPLAKRQAAKTALTTPTTKPTFGAMADQYVETHETDWRNAKHRRQWAITLRVHAASIRNMPVDQVDTQAVLDVLKPLWAKTPETASRLRGRIEVVIDAARALGHISADRANPARWRGHLDKLLPKPKKLSRGHHAAMPYQEVPAFWARLDETPGTAARALQTTILCATRTGETLGMTFDEIKSDKTVWSIPKGRTKVKKAHDVPLSDQAAAILRAQEAEPGKNPHVFPGRPMKPLSDMAMSMLVRRLGVAVTVHGFRSSFRDWAAESGVVFEVAEACLSHRVGSDVTRAYLRTSMLERRRPVLQAWADYVTGKSSANVVPFRAATSE
jgi:integrase